MVDFENCLRAKYVNFDNLKKTIDEGPYDAVIVVSPENVPYYSGFYNFDLRLLPERIHFVIWPRGGEPVFLVVGRRERTLLPGETFITEVVGYDGEAMESASALVEVMKERGVAEGTIAFEPLHFPGGLLERVKAALPKATFKDDYAFLEKPRLIKTPGEIEALTTVAGWTTAAIDTAFREAKPGDTERLVAARMQYELLKNGADAIQFPTFGAGDRSGAFHGLPTDKVIEAGMLFKTDFGGCYDGYYSDLARTVVMGKASDRQKEIHAKVTEIKHRIVASIKPGVLASEVANIGRKAYEDLGLDYKWAILGHSLGLGLHESPQIYPWVHEPILEGMMMMIEVGYSDPPNDSFHVEDLIEITATGAEYRSDVSSHETLWEIGV